MGSGWIQWPWLRHPSPTVQSLESGDVTFSVQALLTDVGWLSDSMNGALSLALPSMFSSMAAATISEFVSRLTCCHMLCYDLAPVQDVLVVSKVHIRRCDAGRDEHMHLRLKSEL